MSPESKITTLKDRAHMLAQVRDFFHKRNILEVDCPQLISSPTIDPHLHPMEVHLENEVRYLHTSPEFAMKRLLCEGIGDIYQLCHVFREGDLGTLHEPEFTLIEWYRLGFTLEQLAKETCELISLFIGKKKIEMRTYKEAFLAFADTNPFAEDIPLLHDWDKITTLEYLWATKVEPHLGKKNLTLITNFPPWQSQFAKIKENTAQRFEVYYQGIELANGYDELTDPTEQRRRLEKANAQRQKPLPIDEHFISALELGMPECSGVAVGFDRLMLLRHGEDSIQNILPHHFKKI